MLIQYYTVVRCCCFLSQGRSIYSVEDQFSWRHLWKNFKSALLYELLKLFHTSNSRGRFPTTLLTLSQRAKARTSAHSLLDWINTMNKEASDHHLPLSLTMTNTHKRTHLHTKSYSDVLIHLSLTGSLASDVECVTPCDTQTHCFITENAGQKTQIALLLEHQSHLSLWVTAREAAVCLLKQVVFVDSVRSHSLKTETMPGRRECGVLNWPQDDTVGNTVPEGCAADTQKHVLLLFRQKVDVFLNVNCRRN